MAVHADGETATAGSYTGVTAAPASYSGFAATTLSADAVGGVMSGVAFRQLNASSEDAGAFTADTSSARHGALLVAIRPAGVPTLTQATYRFYDTGTESGSTALAAQDTGISVDTGAGDFTGVARVRLQSTTAVPVSAADNFNLQWDKNSDAAWADILPADKYQVVALTVALDGVTNDGAGQSFLGNGKKLTRARFYLDSNATTGSITARLYAHSGTYGSGGVPTGAVLAEATTRLNTALSSTLSWQWFDFDGTYTLGSGTAYFIVVYLVGVPTGSVLIGYDNGVRSHAGNGVIRTTAGAWTTSSNDWPFEVYTDDGIIPYDIPNLTDDAVTTNRLGAGSGSFVAGRVVEDGYLNGLGWTANNYTELVFPFKVLVANFVDTDVIRLRVVRNGAALDTYTVYATITISTPAAGPEGTSRVALIVGAQFTATKVAVNAAKPFLVISVKATDTKVAVGSAKASEVLGTKAAEVKIGVASAKSSPVGLSAAVGAKVVVAVDGTMKAVAALGTKITALKVAVAFADAYLIGSVKATETKVAVGTSKTSSAGALKATEVKTAIGSSTISVTDTARADGTKVTTIVTGSAIVVSTIAAKITAVRVALGSAESSLAIGSKVNIKSAKIFLTAAIKATQAKVAVGSVKSPVEAHARETAVKVGVSSNDVYLTGSAKEAASKLTSGASTGFALAWSRMDGVNVAGAVQAAMRVALSMGSKLTSSRLATAATNLSITGRTNQSGVKVASGSTDLVAVVSTKEAASRLATGSAKSAIANSAREAASRSTTGVATAFVIAWSKVDGVFVGGAVQTAMRVAASLGSRLAATKSVSGQSATTVVTGRTKMTGVKVVAGSGKLVAAEHIKVNTVKVAVGLFSVPAALTSRVTAVKVAVLSTRVGLTVYARSLFVKTIAGQAVTALVVRTRQLGVRIGVARAKAYLTFAATFLKQAFDDLHIADKVVDVTIQNVTTVTIQEVVASSLSVQRVMTVEVQKTSEATLNRIAVVNPKEVV